MLLNSMLRCNRHHTEDTPLLDATVQNLVATATRRPGFVHRPVAVPIQYVLDLYQFRIIYRVLMTSERKISMGHCPS